MFAMFDVYIFNIKQLSCQLRKMGGLVITLVKIMIGVRSDEDYTT